MRKSFKIIVNVLVYAAIFFAIAKGVPFALSKHFGTDEPMAAITSGSMWPVLHVGDIVFIEPITKDDIAKGDIVVWRNDRGGFTIHRVVRLNATTFVTKGDANFTEDTPIAYEDLFGRAVVTKKGNPIRVPFVGYAAVFSQKVREGD